MRTDIPAFYSDWLVNRLKAGFVLVRNPYDPQRIARYKLTPDVAAMEILAEYWYGPLCYENSTMDGTQTFPLSEEGIREMTRWLVELSEAKNPQ